MTEHWPKSGQSLMDIKDPAYAVHIKWLYEQSDNPDRSDRFRNACDLVAMTWLEERGKRMTVEQGKWKDVYEELVKIPLFVGNYDAKHGKKAFMHGISAVMEYIAYEAGKQEEYDEMFLKNILKSEREEK